MSKVFTFYGAERGVGVSMLLQSAAELISEERQEVRILILNLQGRPEYPYISYQGVSIGELRDYLDAHVLHCSEVHAASKYRENFHIVGGLKTIGEERYYKPEMAKYLISKLSPEFDLIFADAGSDLDSGLSLGALQKADEVIFVLSQREHVLRRTEMMRVLHEKLNLSFSLNVCNRYDHSDPYTETYLCSRMGIPRESLFCVADLGGKAGRLAESEGRILLDCGDSRYSSDITALTNRILAAAELEPIVKKRKRKWKNFI